RDVLGARRLALEPGDQLAPVLLHAVAGVRPALAPFQFLLADTDVPEERAVRDSDVKRHSLAPELHVHLEFLDPDVHGCTLPLLEFSPFRLRPLDARRQRPPLAGEPVEVSDPPPHEVFDFGALEHMPAADLDRGELAERASPQPKMADPETDSLF